MDTPGLWIGIVVCAAAAAAVLLPLAPLHRLAGASAALLLAPALIAADNWSTARFVDLRDHPIALAAAGLAAALVVAGLVWLFVVKPRLLPLALIALMPFRIPLDLAGSSANLLLPLYAVLAAGMIAAWLRPELVVPRPLPASGPARLLGPLLAAVLVLYALQAGYAGDISVAVENVGFFFVPFAAVFLLLAAAPWDGTLLRLAVVVVAAEALLVAVVGFGQSLTGELFWNQKVIDGNEAHAYFRVNSLFYDPNIMGRYLAVTMIVLAAVAGWTRGRRTAVAVACFAALLVALVLTFSQTSMLALVAGLGVLVVAAWGLGRGLLVSALAVGLLAVTVLGLEGGGLTAETTGRTGLVSGGLELAGDRPLAGFGSGSFAAEFKGRFGGGDGIAVESHTEPVTIAAEQGAVGLLAHAALLGGSVAALWMLAGIGRAPAHDPVAAALLAAYGAMIVHSLGYAAFLTDPITWVLLALAAARASLGAEEAAGSAAHRASARRVAEAEAV